MKLYGKLHKTIIVTAIIIILLLATLGEMATYSPVYAATTYTDVLTDLQSDESFTVSSYECDASDNSLYVIQIAESEDDELFIYVYQPNTDNEYDLTATSINISTTIGDDNLSYKNYGLTLLSSSGTLYKYIVNDFTVKNATVRYYDISAIYRTYYAAIDGAETGGNTTSELAIAVAQCWAAGEANGNTYYDMEETNVVTVQSYAGYIRYWDGTYFNFVSIGTNYYDSHFIAFSCDYDIDELYEADISFYTVPVEYHYFETGIEAIPYEESYTYGDVDDTYYNTPLTISEGETVSINTTGYLNLFSQTTYSWDRICTVSDFINNLDDSDCDYDSDFIENISGKQWVLRFYESEVKYTTSTIITGLDSYTLNYTQVTDVTILRLKFLSEGVTYNLGVVSNKITGSDTASGTVGGVDTESLKDTLKKIAAVITIVLLLVICAPVLPYLAKLIVWVISLPFKLISAIIKAFKKKE